MDGGGTVNDVRVVYDESKKFYLQVIFTKETSGAVEFSILK